LLPEGRPALLPVNTTEQRDELASFQLTELHSMSASQSRTVEYRIGRDQSAAECVCNRSWFCLRSQAAAPLRVWHYERADRAVITAAPEAYMAMVVLTRLHLITPEQVAGRDVEPAEPVSTSLRVRRESGHAAAVPPSSVMNSRRLTDHLAGQLAQQNGRLRIVPRPETFLGRKPNRPGLRDRHGLCAYFCWCL
jgi:hypothetical protein